MSTPDKGASTSIAEAGERALIDRIRQRFPAPPGALTVAIGDDAAVAPGVRGELQVLTTDVLVEGIHFDLAFSSFADVGYKALAVNVSDVAAMGGTPRLALLSLVLPERLTLPDFDGLLDGLPDDLVPEVVEALARRSPQATIVVATGRSDVARLCQRVIPLASQASANPSPTQTTIATPAH